MYKFVLICIDHPDLRRAVRGLVGGMLRDALVMEAPDKDGALALSRAQPPDLVLADLLGANFETESLLKVLSARAPAARLICFSVFGERTLAERALAAGAHAFIISELLAAELSQALRVIRQGERYVSPGVAPQAPGGGSAERRA